MRGNPAELVHPFSEGEKLEIRGQMDRLIKSPYFRQSKRYPNFMRHVVESTLEGQAEGLKERTLGMEIFDREPSYDTSGDSIVRVAAAEVRKRIAQYYQEEAHDAELRIELPTGSYVPHFRHVVTVIEESSALEPLAGAGAEAGKPSETKKAKEPSVLPLTPFPGAGEAAPPGITAADSRKRRLLMIGPGLLLLALGLGYSLLVLNAHAPPTERSLLDPFFSPSDTRVVLCVGSSLPEEKRLPATGLAENGTSDELLEGNRVVPFSEAKVLAMVIGMLEKNSRTSQIELSSSANFNDLRAGPVILIGGLDNDWTRRLDGDFPFVFREEEGGRGQIVERAKPDHILGEVNLGLPAGNRVEDYALVSITQSPTLGEPVLLLAGLGPNGTSAAGEFFQGSGRLQEALRAAPKGWRGKNIAILLSTRVIQGHSGPPQIVAARFW